MTVEYMEKVSQDPNGYVPEIPRSSADATALRIGWAQTAEICRRLERIADLLDKGPGIDPGFKKPKGKKKGLFGK